MTVAADPGAWSRGNLDRCADYELVHKVQLLPRASAEREAACEVLIVRYQPLVRSCALRYREAPETTEELMQAGYVGLLKAI
ncbi:MAG TPA: sigma factor, partial [Gemmatimonadales bacterium]|nr:sigma factor [Gemmatimonadales bacterium]